MNKFNIETLINQAYEQKKTCLQNCVRYEQEHYKGRRINPEEDRIYCDECKGEIKEICDMFFKLTKETFATFE